jgi:poly(glycerol-phosphate) alpha-glucosyltransferase
MPPIELPPGRYLSCAFRVDASLGGQTRALLMRARYLARAGGVRPEILTLSPAADHEERRQELLEHGLLIDEVGMRNVYDHYREHGWGDRAGTGQEPEDLSAHFDRTDERPDGTPWRTVYRLPDRKMPMLDYLRPDGTPFLRTSAYSLEYKSSWPDAVTPVSPDGEALEEYATLGQWFREWIRELAGDEPTFLFIDSRFVVPHIVPTRGLKMHVLYQMHNMHVQAPYRWDSEMHPVYKRVLDRIDGMDAMVSLTERQRDDIALRRGRTTNMFAIPNPVAEAEEPPADAKREPRRATIVARLELQKRLTHAIGAWEQVVAALRDAHLDIYGDGSRREALQELIDERGLGDAVTLHGFDPRARDALWRSSAFLMTSVFEGYPLSTLESMARGCPVVSYDIKYGPREQITDGVDGFLVPEGDQAQLAARVIELLGDPERVARMSEAAREKARSLAPDGVLARWAEVLAATAEQKRRRTRLEEVDVTLGKLRLAPAGRLARLVNRGPELALGPVEAPAAVELEGTVRVEAQTRQGTLDAVVFELAWVDEESGAIEDVGIDAKRRKDEEAFRIRAVAPVPEAGTARLRLRLLWENSAWETDVVTVGGEPRAVAQPEETPIRVSQPAGA